MSRRTIALIAVGMFVVLTLVALFITQILKRPVVLPTITPQLIDTGTINSPQMTDRGLMYTKNRSSLVLVAQTSPQSLGTLPANEGISINPAGTYGATTNNSTTSILSLANLQATSKIDGSGFDWLDSDTYVIANNAGPVPFATDAINIPQKITSHKLANNAVVNSYSLPYAMLGVMLYSGGTTTINTNGQTPLVDNQIFQLNNNQSTKISELANFGFKRFDRYNDVLLKTSDNGNLQLLQNNVLKTLPLNSSPNNIDQINATTLIYVVKSNPAELRLFDIPSNRNSQVAKLNLPFDSNQIQSVFVRNNILYITTQTNVLTASLAGVSLP
jgi:hypothetical protein